STACVVRAHRRLQRRTDRSRQSRTSAPSIERRANHMSASISIVTPTLNAARWLPACLASLEAQGYPAMEHIGVDGGSHDATREIARTSSGVVLLERPGSNQANAINQGFRAASGDILAWLNADDEYTPGALERVGALFESRPDLDAVYGDCDVVDVD